MTDSGKIFRTPAKTVPPNTKLAGAFANCVSLEALGAATLTPAKATSSSTVADDEIVDACTACGHSAMLCLGYLIGKRESHLKCRKCGTGALVLVATGRS